MYEQILSVSLGVGLALLARVIWRSLAPRPTTVAHAENAPPKTDHGTGMSAVVLSRINDTIIVAPWLDY
jgi:hypothetical protein